MLKQAKQLSEYRLALFEKKFHPVMNQKQTFSEVGLSRRSLIYERKNILSASRSTQN